MLEELSNDLQGSVHWNSCEEAGYIKADHKVVLLHGGLANPFHKDGGVLNVRISAPTHAEKRLSVHKGAVKRNDTKNGIAATVK